MKHNQTANSGQSDLFETDDMRIATEYNNIAAQNDKLNPSISDKYDDSLEHFITIVKKITKAYTINIYSAKPFYQIYQDACTDSPEIVSNEDTLNQFLKEYNSNS